jgi:hypothetical protein
MADDVHLPQAWIDKQDASFFLAHPDRRSHIRKPFGDEMKGEFWSLGDHEPARRRVILWRVPPGNPAFDPARPVICKLGMLAYADETIEDDDGTLLPVVEELMQEARKTMEGSQ